MLLQKKIPADAVQSLAQEMGWVEPDSVFEKLLEDTMTAENPNSPKKAGFIRPSSLTRCLRKLVFEYQGVEEERSYDGTPRIGESGTDAHTRIQGYIMKMKEHGHDITFMSVEEYLEKFPNPDLEIIDEAKDHKITFVDVVKNEIHYDDKVKSLTEYMERYRGPETLVYNKRTKSRFKTDGIILWSGKYYVLEIKTENTTKFNKHKTTKEPYEKHKLQGTYYGSEAFGIDRVMFLYEHRDTCKFFVSIFKITPEDKKLVRYLVDETLRYGDNGWIAPRTVDKDECRFCPYLDRCTKIGDTMPL